MYHEDLPEVAFHLDPLDLDLHDLAVGFVLSQLVDILQVAVHFHQRWSRLEISFEILEALRQRFEALKLFALFLLGCDALLLANLVTVSQKEQTATGENFLVPTFLG